MTRHSGPPLIVEHCGNTVLLTLNRPGVHNAMNLDLLAALGDAIIEFESSETDRVAIIVGAGEKAFSTGADLKDAVRRDDAGTENYYAFDSLPRGFAELETCRKPVIAAISGYCLAGGMELSLLCDIRVASRSAVFGLPEVRRALLPNGGLHDLPRLIPRGEALMMQLTGSPMTAERAFQVGLVQTLAGNRAEALDAAQSIADDVILGAPLAIRACKDIVRLGQAVTVGEARRQAVPISEMIHASEDRIEGVRSFVERRAPIWRNR